VVFSARINGQILRTAAKAVYVPPRALYPGYLLWMQDQTLLAQRFDADALKLEGDPVSVAEQVGIPVVLSARLSGHPTPGFSCIFPIPLR
jgi:hypothetical protein